MTLDQLIAEVRAERLRRGVTYAEVAERMGCSQSFVQAIEYRSGVDRRWNTVMAYAEAVGVEIRVEVITPTVGETPE